MERKVRNRKKVRKKLIRQEMRENKMRKQVFDYHTSISRTNNKKSICCNSMSDLPLLLLECDCVLSPGKNRAFWNARC